MTLAPRNEAVRRENHAEKKSFVRKKIILTIREVMEDVRIVLLSRNCKIL
jgi:hypothetical protein